MSLDNSIFRQSAYLTTTVKASDWPATDTPEIVFVGRSNVGKSSFINLLAQQQRLAFASRTPGRTRTMNWFTVNNQSSCLGHFIDLPGYGYSKASYDYHDLWENMLNEYFIKRDNLKKVVWILDARFGIHKTDLMFYDWYKAFNLPTCVVVNKIDKINQSDLAKLKVQLKHDFSQLSDVDIFYISCLKQRGLKPVTDYLTDIYQPK